MLRPKECVRARLLEHRRHEPTSCMHASARQAREREGGGNTHIASLDSPLAVRERFRRSTVCRRERACMKT